MRWEIDVGPMSLGSLLIAEPGCESAGEDRFDLLLSN